MNITLCISGLTSYIGGAERSLIELANSLNAKGYNITIINCENNNRKESSLFYPVVSDINLITFNTFSKEYKTRKLFSNRFYHVRLSKKNLHLRVLQKEINIIFFNGLSGITKRRASKNYDNKLMANHKTFEWIQNHKHEIKLWRKNILKSKPDIVISFMQKTFVCVTFAISSKKIKHIIAHRIDPAHSTNMYNDKSLKHLIEYAVELSYKNVIQSELYSNYFSIYAQKKTIVIPNPIVPIINNREALVEKRKIILGVGRYHPQKNFSLLIRAFHQISHKFPEWEIQLYGDDNGEKELLINLVTELSMCNKIHINDPISTLEEKYDESSIFVLPSLFEGFSRALGEAMAHGLPCLVLQECLHNNYMITNGAFGMASRNDSKVFAQDLELLMKDKDLREKFGSNAKSYALNFLPENIYNQWESIIRSN